MLDQKAKYSIINVVNKIENSNFDEGDLKILLIDIREWVNENSFTKELGDFIAHRVRDKGICYSELNLRHIILNNKMNENSYFSNPKDFHEVDQILFESLIDVGLPKVIKRAYPKNQKEQGVQKKRITSIVKDAYLLDKKAKKYKIKSFDNFNLIKKIFIDLLDQVDTMPLKTSEQMIFDLDKELSLLFKKEIKHVKYNKAILRNQKDIAICLLSLMQDITFKMKDGTNGKFKLSIKGEDADFYNYNLGFEYTSRAEYEEKLRLKICQQTFNIIGHTLYESAPEGSYISTTFILTKIPLNEYLTEVTINTIVNNWSTCLFELKRYETLLDIDDDVLKSCHTQRVNGMLKLLSDFDRIH